MANATYRSRHTYASRASSQTTVSRAPQLTPRLSGVAVRALKAKAHRPSSAAKEIVEFQTVASDFFRTRALFPETPPVLPNMSTADRKIPGQRRDTQLVTVAGDYVESK